MPTVREVVAAELDAILRLAGHDVTPGHDELHHYWTRGEGLAKWVHSPHPWTALYHHLVKHVNPEMAKRMASAWFHEVLGFWPGEKHVGAVRVPKGAARSALIRGIVRAELVALSGDMDDDPVGELDEATKALVQALEELRAEAQASRAWDPGKHPRGPDGKFLNIVDQIKDAIKNHKPGGKHPLEDFNREQLRGAAKKLNIPLKRGEDKKAIADKLLFDLVPMRAPQKPKATPQVAIPGVKLARAPQVFGNAPDHYLVHYKGTHVGHIHGDENKPALGWAVFAPGGASWRVENPGIKKNKTLAVQELVDSYAAAHAQVRPNAQIHAKPLKAPKDNIDNLDDRDLRDLAAEYGVPHVGRPIEDVRADVKRKAKAEKAAQARLAAKLAKAGPAAKYHRNIKGLEDMARLVETENPQRERILGGGAIGDTRVRTYADGTRLVWKKTTTKKENDAEQLAALTARALGLPAPRIYRNDEKSVNMEFIDGDVAYQNPQVGGLIGDVPHGVADSSDGRMMGLLDLLINNQDRHNGNWLIRPDGRYVPIDHGYAFEGAGKRLPVARKFAPVRSGFANHYYDEWAHQWHANDLAKGDITEIRRRLEKLRPDFEHVGQARWHDFMLQRLDAIGQHASGTKSRLLPALVQ